MVPETLALVIASKKGTMRKLAGDLLVKHITRQKPAFLKKNLKNNRPEIRTAVAHIIGVRRLKFFPELIALLKDESSMVRQAARGSLKRLSGRDFGPAPKSGAAQRSHAVRAWQLWWEVVSTRK